LTRTTVGLFSDTALLDSHDCRFIVGYGARLGDFVVSETEESFELLLPFTMVRKHDSSVEVRSYGEGNAVDLAASARRRSKPSRPSTTQLSRVLVEVHDEYGNEEEPDESRDLFVDLVDDVSDDLAEDAVGRLEKDLDAVRLAEMRSNQAEFERNFESLHCENLGPVPEVVRNKFSCVLGDVFHAIDRVKIHTRHEWKKAYKHALVKAFLEWDPKCLEEELVIMHQLSSGSPFLSFLPLFFFFFFFPQH
jgi:hypothetical protein